MLQTSGMDHLVIKLLPVREGMAAMHCGKTQREKSFSKRKDAGQERAAKQSLTMEVNVLVTITYKMICTSAAVPVICAMLT